MFSDSSKPKYLEMAETFRKDILSGVYQEGSRLPSDEVIAKTFGINKRTVAAGMAQLVKGVLILRNSSLKLKTVADNAILLNYAVSSENISESIKIKTENLFYLKVNVKS